MRIVYCSHPSSVVLCIQNSVFSIKIISLYGSQTSPVDLWMQNRVLRSRMTLVYWSQPSSVVLCIQKSDFSFRKTSLYGSHPSFVAIACKTATLRPELQVSIGPRHHLWFFTLKAATLAPELLVSMCPSPHLWLLHAKQRLKAQNYTSLWVQDLTYGFLQSNQRL